MYDIYKGVIENQKTCGGETLVGWSEGLNMPSIFISLNNPLNYISSDDKSYQCHSSFVFMSNDY